MNNKLFIVGAGGFGKEVLSCYSDMQRDQNLKIDVCFLVEDQYWKDEKILGVEVLLLSSFTSEMGEVVVAIGEPEVRKRIVSIMPPATRYATIIHPSVVCSEWVRIGEGAILTAGVILTTDISIGSHAQLNLKTSIGHDCRIGDYFTTAPGVSVSGNCIIGNEVYLGTNSCIKQGLAIGDRVTIGMGAVVVKSIAVSGIFIGNPARILNK